MIAPDLLGHGHSAKPRGDYSLGNYAAGLRDLLTILGIGRVTVVGHSLGGGVAHAVAYQFPDRLRRLVLVDSRRLGNEVALYLRAATLPFAEYVIPVLFSSPTRYAGRTIGSVLGRLGMKANATCGAWRRAWSHSATPASVARSSTLRGRSSTPGDSGSTRVTGSISHVKCPPCSCGANTTA